MKTISFVPFLLFVFWQSHCQTPPPSEPLVNSGWSTAVFGSSNHSNISSVPKSRNLQYEQIEGSPYINNNSGANKNLPIGKFYSASNEYLETALARYNAYTDDMEVSLLDDGQDYYFLKKKPESFYIKLNNTTYRAYEFEDDFHFFMIVSKNDTGRCSLLKKQRIVFQREERASNSFVTGSPDRFRRLKDVYYFKIDSLIKEVPKKKKHLHNLFGEKNSEMKDYIKATKLKLTKEEDLLKISAYYNSLFY